MALIGIEIDCHDEVRLCLRPSFPDYGFQRQGVAVVRYVPASLGGA